MSFEDKINEHFVKGAGPYSIAINYVAKEAARASQKEKTIQKTEAKEITKNDSDEHVL